MFLEIFWFDFKRNLKRPSVWLFFAGLFIFTAVYTASLGGAIPGAKNQSLAYVNSARSCAMIINGLINNSLIGTTILITLIAPAIQKDYQYNSQSIYFTKPISKFGYVIGRFISGYLTALIVCSGVLIAFILVSNLPIYPPGKMGSYGIWTYLQGFIYLIVPNTFFVGTLFFSIVTLSRNLIAGYITSVFLLMALNNSSLMPVDVGSLTLSLKDPYGFDAVAIMTSDWTPVMENKLPISFSGYLFYNRLLWTILSSLLFLYTYLRFDFQQYSSKFSLFRKGEIDDPEGGASYLKQSPIVTTLYDAALSVKQWISLTKMELKNLIKSPYFFIILLLPSVIYIIDGDRGNGSNKPQLSTTIRMIDAIFNFSRVYVNIIVVFYSGALVWRERNFKIEDIISSTPIKTSVLMYSKITSLVGLYLLITVYFIVFFIFFQIAKGFTDIQPFLYFQYLLGYNLLNIIIIVCFVVSVQAIAGNRYIGYLISVVVMLFVPIVLDALGIRNDLMRFNSGNRFLYSELKGLGSGLVNFVNHKIYWLSFISALLITANLIWSRGKERGFRNRLILARNNITKSHWLLYVLSLGCMAIFGIIVS